MEFYVVGTTDNEYEVMDFDFDNVQRDYKQFDEDLKANGYLLEHEDESGFHYKNTVFRDPVYAWIVKLYVPVN